MRIPTDTVFEKMKAQVLNNITKNKSVNWKISYYWEIRIFLNCSYSRALWVPGQYHSTFWFPDHRHLYVAKRTKLTVYFLAKTFYQRNHRQLTTQSILMIFFHFILIDEEENWKVLNLRISSNPINCKIRIKPKNQISLFWMVWIRKNIATKFIPKLVHDYQRFFVNCL